MVISSFSDSCHAFTHILQGCSTGTGEIVYFETVLMTVIQQQGKVNKTYFKFKPGALGLVIPFCVGFKVLKVSSSLHQIKSSVVCLVIKQFPGREHLCGALLLLDLVLILMCVLEYGTWQRLSYFGRGSFQA